MYSLNINTISHILKHVNVISNNKEYEIKILWERTNYKRESKLGWKGARKYLRERRKLLKERGVMQVREHVFSIYKRRRKRRSKEYCVMGGWHNILMCVLARHCALCSTCALYPVPTCVYADQKWLWHCNCNNPLHIVVGKTTLKQLSFGK